jgi:hypothetical protein
MHWEQPGSDTPRCKARTKRRMRAIAEGSLPPDTDVQCLNDAMSGQAVCRMHGGAQQSGREKGKMVVAERKLNDQLSQLAESHLAVPVDNPLGALQQLAGECVQLKDIFAQRVAKLKAPGYASKAGEQLRSDMAVYERALDRTSKVLTDIARLNIDDRLVRIEEQQAELMVAIFIEAVSKMGMGERAPEARRIISGLIERS